MESDRLSVLNIENPVLYAILLILVLLSAYFSSAETAFSSCNIIRLKNYVEEGRKGAKKALYSAERFEKTLTTILIGNNVVNIGLATISATVMKQVFDSPTVANIVNTLGVTAILLIFGEILPKSIAKESAEGIALKYGASMYFLTIVMTPIAVMLSPIKRTVNKIYNVEAKPSFTDDELETLIDTMEEEGTIEEDSADMMQGVLDLKDKDVDDIMTPRVDVVMINIDANIKELKEIFIDFQLSRIPVYRKDKDNIIGKVHFKDFMLALFDDKEISINDIMSEVHYVPETMSVDDLIEELQKNKEHMAIVTGEYGGTAGVVTMEDALEVLVGEIFDEHDEEFAEFLPLGNDKYMIHGDFNLVDLFDELDLPEPDSGYSSVGGFIYENLEKYPEIEDYITYECVIHSEEIGEDTITKELVFTVKDVSDRRILSVELNIKEKEEL
ncbi:hemolysin family protein [Mycoplasmatota bacterium WC44]